MRAMAERRVTLSPDRPADRRSAGDRIRDAGTWALLAIAAWAPLPFGSARPWASGVLAVMIGALLMILAICHLALPSQALPRLRPLAWSAGLFALAIAWALVQCIPWVPTGWQHPIWHEAQGLLDDPVSASISMDRGASRSAILHLLTDAAIFWLGFRCAQQSDDARRLFAAVAAIGAIYAGWGLLIYGAGNHSILWFEKWAYPLDLTSTFVNRNSFATFVGLSLVVAIGLLLDTILRKVDLGQERKIVLRALAELLTTRAAWLIGAIAVTATALLLTHSRGGAAATGLGVLSLLGVASLAPSLRGPWRASFAIVLTVSTLAAILVSGATTLDRIAGTAWDIDGRHEIYTATLDAIGNTPLVGSGLGTFKWVFPPYRTEDVSLPVELAHDDYLENMLELGIPAAVTLIGSVLLLVLRCVRGAFLRRRDALLPCLGVGASVLVGSHALVDFSLQIPAVAMSYLLILGAAVAQSASTRSATDQAGASKRVTISSSSAG
jgi:O-antigen ligase